MKESEPKKEGKQINKWNQVSHQMKAGELAHMQVSQYTCNRDNILTTNNEIKLNQVVALAPTTQIHFISRINMHVTLKGQQIGNLLSYVDLFILQCMQGFGSN